MTCAPFSALSAVVLDFDGTIVDSNTLKRAGFFAVAATFGLTEKAVQSALERGGDRYAIAAHMFGENARASQFCAAYKTHCEAGILRTARTPGFSEFLDAIRQNRVPVFIVSATPHDDLLGTVSLLGLSDAFDGVYGGHGRKRDNLRRICEDRRISPCDVIVVGDNIEDLEAARDEGCPFVAMEAWKADAMKYSAPPTGRVADFYELADLLRHVGLLNARPETV